MKEKRTQNMRPLRAQMSAGDLSLLRKKERDREKGKEERTDKGDDINLQAHNGA